MEQKKKGRGKLIWPFLKPSLPLLLTALFFSVMITVCQAMIPQVIRFGVDGVLGGNESGAPDWLVSILPGWAAESASGALTFAALAIVFLAALNICGNYGQRVFSAKGSETFVKGLRDKLYDHIQRLPYAWHVKEKTGDIIQRCTSDVEVVRNFITQQLFDVFRISFLIIFNVAVMFTMNVKITLVAVSFLPVVMIYSGYFFGKISKRFRDADEAEGDLSADVQENLSGVRVVRAFGREQFEREKFDKKNDRFADLWIYLGKYLSVYWSVGDLLTGMQILTVICLGVTAAVGGEITVGEFIAFVSYNASMAWPVRGLGRILSEMSKATVSIDRLAYILEAQEEKSPENAKEPPMNRDIRFEDVHFAYEGGSEVIKGVSFTVPAGKTFAILGNTGSGKSTLVHLLDRLYDLPRDKGTISVGGVDIRDIDLYYLRKNIGLVLQEPFLFSGTIRENVGITLEDPKLEDIREATQIACVDSAIDSFSDGYETIVGEKGVTLSGGQKQRVAIARMLVQNTPVMIFDDSLSAVDAETDAMIREQLKERMQDATVILISHRITTLMAADLIMVLEDGKIAQMGTHEELLKEEGIYRRVYDIQMLQEGGDHLAD